MVTDGTRRWMRELADLREEAANLPQRDGADEATRNLFFRALRLAEALREDLAAGHQHCMMLESEVHSAHARTERVFNSLPMAAVTTDLQGVIQWANPAAGVLLGRSHTLKDQLLLHYAEDRLGFSALVQRARGANDHVVTSTIRIRPRERAVLNVTIVALLDARDASNGTLLWFLQAEGIQPRAALPLRAPSPRRRSAPINQPRL
jgi:PAS domain-containing protein